MNGFPSPIGVLLISTKSILNCYRKPVCFRPLSGFFLFLRTQLKESKSKVVDSFRPLSGFFLFLLPLLSSKEMTFQFPSPIGVLLISTDTEDFINKILGDVSVPYRGSSYFYRSEILRMSSTTRVSVPYRGSSYFYTQKMTFINEANLFPSPIGVLLISTNLKVGYNNTSR